MRAESEKEDIITITTIHHHHHYHPAAALPTLGRALDLGLKALYFLSLTHCKRLASWTLSLSFLKDKINCILVLWQKQFNKPTSKPLVTISWVPQTCWVLSIPSATHEYVEREVDPTGCSGHSWGWGLGGHPPSSHRHCCHCLGRLASCARRKACHPAWGPVSP